MKLKKQFNLSNESGVTLIELIAAIAILSIIVLSFLSAFIQSARTNDRASDINEATFIAQEEMELMVNYSQTLSITDVSNLDEFTGAVDKLTKTATSGEFNIATNLILVTESETTDLYSVIVEVRKSDTLQTLLENRLAFE